MESESLTGFELFLPGKHLLWVGRSNRFATHIDSLYKYKKIYRTKCEGTVVFKEAPLCFLIQQINVQKHWRDRLVF